MRLWRSDPYTGNFPPLRIAWNLLWLIPMYVSYGLFCVCVGFQSGVGEAIRAWEEMM